MTTPRFSITVSKNKPVNNNGLARAFKVIAGVILSFICNKHEKTKTNDRFILTRRGLLIFICTQMQIRLFHMKLRNASKNTKQGKINLSRALRLICDPLLTLEIEVWWKKIKYGWNLQRNVSHLAKLGSNPSKRNII